MKSNKWGVLYFLIYFSSCFYQSTESKQLDPKVTNVLNDKAIILNSLCRQFNELNTAIRDLNIDKSSAKKRTKILLDSIHLFLINEAQFLSHSIYVFPLKGYNSSVIGGQNGSGYISAGFDFFDGNNRKGHPAHDIFIFDSNQDCIDDKTKLPAPVLSFTSGIVIAVEKEWNATSNLKGGKYIYIYSPQCQKIFYYAHNDKIMVSIGQIVQAGEQISTVGRTGFSAYQKRSPTHLHFMELELDSAYFPRPKNPYMELLKCKTM